MARRHDKLTVKLIFIAWSLSANLSFAAAWVYPGPPAAIAPLADANTSIGFSLAVSSGTFATPSISSTDYTATFSGNIFSNNGVVTVSNGAVLSYFGTNTAASTLRILAYTSTGVGTVSITVAANGTLSKGTGTNAIELIPAITAQDAIATVNLSGTIIGDVRLLNGAHVNIVTSAAKLNGNLSGGNDLSIGAGVNFTTSGNIDMDIVNLTVADTTLNVANNIIISNAFNTVASTTLNLNDGITIESSGAGAFVNPDNATVNFNLSSANAMPSISMDATSTLNGPINVVTQNRYIAAGNYPMLTVSSGTVSSTGVFSFNDTSRYLTGTRVITSNQVYFQVVRSDYPSHALTPAASQIGAFFERLGAGSPTANQLLLLSNLDSTTTDQHLTSALLSITPPVYTKLQTLQELNQIIGLVETRISKARHDSGLSFGDFDPEPENGVWVRPFTSSSTQRAHEVIQPYTATNKGVAFGIDKIINDAITLGFAGSMSKSKVNDSSNPLTFSNMKNYQAMFYGSRKSKTDSYLDWVIAAGVNNYKSYRTLNVGALSGLTTSKYAGNQFAIKGTYSKNYILAQYLQLTPLASAQYSYLQQPEYTENSAAGFNMIVNTENVSVFTLGAGAKIAAPFAQGNMLLMPSLHAIVTSDVKGGAINTNSQFVDGGPFFSASVQTGKVMFKLGASLELKLSDRLNLIASYDIERRKSFNGHSFYANIRCLF